MNKGDFKFLIFNFEWTKSSKYWKSFQNSKLNSRGVTMIEAMIVMAIIGATMALVFRFAYIGTTAWQKQYARTKLLSQAQNFMYILSYDLRQAQSAAVTITTAPGETQANSMIIFTMTGQTQPVSFYLKTTTVSGTVTQKQVLLSTPVGLGATPTYTYLSGGYVVASDVASVYFTYPYWQDFTRILASITLQRVPFKNQVPVFVQQNEIINLRD